VAINHDSSVAPQRVISSAIGFDMSGSTLRPWGDHQPTSSRPVAVALQLYVRSMNRFFNRCVFLLATTPLLAAACGNVATIPPQTVLSAGDVAPSEGGSKTLDSVLVDGEEPTPQRSQRLVTLADNDAGWVIIGDTSQWLSPECRTDIETSGGWFEPVAWEILESTSDAATELACADVVRAPSVAAPSDEAQLARGINFAGDFEVEPRGAWGQSIPDEDFARAAAAGFDHIRVPIRWSSHTGAAPDYLIDQGFLAEVDHLVNLAHAEGLTIIIDVHHFEQLDQNPAGERNHYLAIWEQLADHYRDEPASVVFELLNEPIGRFNDQPELWNELAADALSIVRQTNPDRTVIIGPVSYNHADRLEDLELPQDPNLVVTIHTYDPDSFTTQGAVFIDPVPANGVTWRADNAAVAFDWQQQSWDVRLAPTPDGIFVEWDRTFAAFAVAPVDDPATFDQVQFTTSEPFSAEVLCNYDTNARAIDVSWTGATGTADVSDCGAISSLALQHTDTELVPVTISRFAGCATSCEELIMTQWDSLDALITGAADWAATEGVPLYIGEFGTYDSPETPIDPASRFAWTHAVATIAEQNNAGWAYFAMSDEFGAYDRNADRWRPEVLNALIN